MVDDNLEVILKDATGKVIIDKSAGSLATSQWVKGETYRATHKIPVTELAGNEYSLSIAVLDPRTDQRIQLPLVDEEEGAYRIGTLVVTDAE